MQVLCGKGTIKIDPVCESSPVLILLWILSFQYFTDFLGFYFFLNKDVNTLYHLKAFL